MSLLFLTYSDENNENVFMQAINRSSQVDTFCVFKGGANRFQRMFRRFSVETEQSFLHYWFSNAWFNNLDAYDTVVITASLYTPSILHWLHKRYPEKRLINYYWDQVSVSHYPVEQSSDFENWSFDEEDCEKYKMRYNPQFYSKFIDVKGSVVSNDISSYVVSGDDVVSENRDDNSRDKRERDEREHKCGLVECPDGDRQDEYDASFDASFVGADREGLWPERVELVNNLYAAMSLANIKVFFYLVTRDKKAYEEIRKNTRLSEKEYLDVVRRSKAIIDIADWMTLRPLLALSNRKKVITNYKGIKNYDFYNEDNIFLLGQDSMERLPDFIDEPFRSYEGGELEKYEVDHWVERFCINVT